jgi:hypothetical protein
MGGEAQAAPGVSLFVVRLQGSTYLELRRDALAVVGLGGGQGLAGEVLGAGFPQGRAAQGRVETPVAQGVEETGVHRQPLAVEDQGVGRHGGVGAHGLDEAVADDHGGAGQDLAGLDDHAGVADGEDRRPQGVGLDGQEWDGKEQNEAGGGRQETSKHGAFPPGKNGYVARAFRPA